MFTALNAHYCFPVFCLLHTQNRTISYCRSRVCDGFGPTIHDRYRCTRSTLGRAMEPSNSAATIHFPWCRTSSSRTASFGLCLPRTLLSGAPGHASKNANGVTTCRCVFFPREKGRPRQAVLDPLVRPHEIQQTVGVAKVVLIVPR